MGSDATAQFLYAAIGDLQGTVRAVDFKAEVMLFAVTVPLSILPTVSIPLWNMVTAGSLIVRIFTACGTLGMVVFWPAAFIATFRVLVGSHNPGDSIADHSPANGAFYSGGLFKFKMTDLMLDRLVTAPVSLKQHIASLPTDVDGVIAELAFEQLKLAYMCSRKIAMFNLAVRLTVFGVCAGILLLLLRLFA
jgi:hypothetical protein